VLTTCDVLVQAVRDTAASEEEMTVWLQERMQLHTLPQLLKLVDQINHRVLPSSGNPTHVFPVLPGSHLTEVSTCSVL
jgi:hypothetical protein